MIADFILFFILGIEELIALRELDAAYNCISRPDQLESLKQCLNLQQVFINLLYGVSRDVQTKFNNDKINSFLNLHI